MTKNHKFRTSSLTLKFSSLGLSSRTEQWKGSCPRCIRNHANHYLCSGGNSSAYHSTFGKEDLDIQLNSKFSNQKSVGQNWMISIFIFTFHLPHHHHLLA